MMRFVFRCADALTRCSATLTAVRAAHAVEAIAAEVVQQAESSGQLVSMSLINRAVEQLQRHRSSCRCGLCGETVAKARADRVSSVAPIALRTFLKPSPPPTLLEVPGITAMVSCAGA